MQVDLLHTNISIKQRINVIKDFNVSDIYSAPGHEFLRNPENVLKISEQLEQEDDYGYNMFKKCTV
jgi:hypothetical protein